MKTYRIDAVPQHLVPALVAVLAKVAQGYHPDTACSLIAKSHPVSFRALQGAFTLANKGN
jgi:hypothetical protein